MKESYHKVDGVDGAVQQCVLGMLFNLEKEAIETWKVLKESQRNRECSSPPFSPPKCGTGCVRMHMCVVCVCWRKWNDRSMGNNRHGIELHQESRL